ncbi:alpha/beta fold hydrolase [Sphingobium sp. D43FB]|uniref:alpha/beta fold hydrolase n=1 Tax=Sphingobium sp. D43FB TaxID=2017595 RepID=UPI000BB55725|nr:alpha/beta fold hydrolase [Sphingobium sp. D43FB]PBN41842.1 hypothetical protein SxD43FB_19680 [Sphingobium sp. D43FB]
MPDISLGGYITHYKDDNFSTPWRCSDIVLIQHGFGRNANFWWHWVPSIASEFRLIRRDLRGHGGSSDGGSAPWTFDGLVEDLRDFCDALDVETIHLIGESTGGMLSVGFAHRFPERVKSLTLCNAPTTINEEGQKFFAGNHSSWKVALSELGAKGWSEWLLKQPGTAACETEAEKKWILDQMARTSTEAMIGYSDVISSIDVASVLPELKVPTLVLAPTRSSAAPLDAQRSMANGIPGARLAVIDSRGHETYWDRRDDCVAAWRAHVVGIV